MNRDDLLDRLSNCPSGVFRKVVTYLKPPAGTLSSEMNSQATRAGELLEWAEHSDGSGIEKLERCYIRAISTISATESEKQESVPKNPLNTTQIGGLNVYFEIQKILTNLSSLPNHYLLVPVLIVSLIVTSSLQGVKSFGLLQSAELNAFDWSMRLRSLIRPLNKPDPRILVITVDTDDTVYQDKEKMGRKEGWSLADKALAKLLLKLKPYQPSVIGLNISHPYRFNPELENILKKSENFVASCEIGVTKTPKEDTQPPPGISTKHLGFSDLPRDNDTIIRRQLLLMAAGEECNTSQAFSLQIAHKYLAHQRNVPPIKKLPDGRRELGGHIIEKLEYNTGGYNLHTDETRGYQILLNYRYSDPEIIRLEDVLNGSSDSKLSRLVKNRIVLIGINKPQQDQHRTVFFDGNSYSEKPGVIVHSHMISQILDLVLENKPLLWWFPEWLEFVWIEVWSVVGIWLVIKWRSPVNFGYKFALTLFILGCSSPAFLLFDVWVSLIPSTIAFVVSAGVTFISIVLINLFSTSLIYGNK